MPPRNGNKKVQVFQTLKKVGKDIRKLIEELYKEFVNILITLKETLDSEYTWLDWLIIAGKQPYYPSRRR